MALVALVAALPGCSVLMPGDSFRGPLPIVSDVQRSVAEQLRADVETLATRIGERNAKHPAAYAAAEDFLGASLARAGYLPRWQRFASEEDGTTSERSNFEVELTGTTRRGEIVLIGAHYDTYPGTPGADDNASGCAAVLALAREFAGRPQERTVRFVLFANEEPPHFWTDSMGSLVYARAAKAKGEDIVAMLSLETIGFYSAEAGSQDYPPPVGMFYPPTGDFIAFVGHSSSEALVKECVEIFRGAAQFPCEGAALPTLVPRIGSSDHWSFWKQGWPAVMVTDTAPYRNRNYHKPTDTPEKLDYERAARVVSGLVEVVRGLSRGE